MPDHSIQWLTLLASGTSANIAAACAPICGACCAELDIDEALQAWGIDAGQSSTDEPSQHGVWRAWQAGFVTPGSVQYLKSSPDLPALVPAILPQVGGGLYYSTMPQPHCLFALATDAM